MKSAFGWKQYASVLYLQWPYPTELRVEAFSPPYLDTGNVSLPFFSFIFSSPIQISLS